MRRPILLALLALLVLPGGAFAAKAKISPNAETVSSAGVASIEAANPNSYVLRGKATVLAGGRTIASKTVRLPKRSVSEIKVRLGAKALAALRSAGNQRVTVKLRLRRAGGSFTTAKRKLTLRAPVPAAPAPAPGGQSATPPPPPPPPASNRWIGRMGTEGEYDDLAFTLDNGQLTFTKMPLVLVSCAENGAGRYGIHTSAEPFAVAGPWTIGTDGLVAQTGRAVNQLVNSGEKSINYKVTETVQAPGRVTGKIGMSFSDSKMLPTYPVWQTYFINCFGTQSFEAVPAP